MTEAYSRLAGRYVELFGSGAHEHPDDLALVERHLARVPGPVLDLGCGPGHLTRTLHDLGADVTGIDRVPEFLAHARSAHPGVRFEQRSLTDPGRPDGSVAGVLAWYSLVHLDPARVDGVLAGIRRLLAPGGALVVGLFDGAAVEPFDHRVVTAYRWPAGQFARRLDRAGFTEVERVQRGQDGERRPHAAIAARAV